MRPTKPGHGSFGRAAGFRHYAAAGRVANDASGAKRPRQSLARNTREATRRKPVRSTSARPSNARLQDRAGGTREWMSSAPDRTRQQDLRTRRRRRGAPPAARGTGGSNHSQPAIRRAEGRSRRPQQTRGSGTTPSRSRASKQDLPSSGNPEPRSRSPAAHCRVPRKPKTAPGCSRAYGTLPDALPGWCPTAPPSPAASGTASRCHGRSRASDPASGTPRYPRLPPRA